MTRRRMALAAVLLTMMVLTVPVVAIGSAFIGNAPLEDGRELASQRVFTIVDGYVACFLIDTGNGYVLIDACQDPDAKAIRAALAKRGGSVDQIHQIVLTHSHRDHIGGALSLGAPVRALPGALPRLEGREAHLGPVPGLMGKRDTGIRVENPLKDGDRFIVGDSRFQVFAVPGHTAGSAAILAHGVLFLGDNAGYKSSGKLVGAPWVFTDDTAENAASLRALAARLQPHAEDIRWLAPAHTGPAATLAPLAAY